MSRFEPTRGQQKPSEDPADRAPIDAAPAAPRRPDIDELYAARERMKQASLLINDSRFAGILRDALNRVAPCMRSLLQTPLAEEPCRIRDQLKAGLLLDPAEAKELAREVRGSLARLRALRVSLSGEVDPVLQGLVGALIDGLRAPYREILVELQKQRFR